MRRWGRHPPPASYLANAGTASDVGVTLEDVQGVLIAVAPIVGSARVVSASGNIAGALGFAIAVLEVGMRPQIRHSGASTTTGDRDVR